MKIGQWKYESYFFGFQTWKSYFQTWKRRKLSNLSHRQSVGHVDGTNRWLRPRGICYKLGNNTIIPSVTFPSVKVSFSKFERQKSSFHISIGRFSILIIYLVLKLQKSGTEVVKKQWNKKKWKPSCMYTYGVYCYILHRTRINIKSLGWETKWLRNVFIVNVLYSRMMIVLRIPEVAFINLTIVLNLSSLRFLNLCSGLCCIIFLALLSKSFYNFFSFCAFSNFLFSLSTNSL